MIALMLLMGTPAWAQRNEPVRLEGVEVMVSGPDHIGRRVVVTNCRLWRNNDRTFGCLVMNSRGESAGTIMVSTRGLPRDDLRRMLDRCASLATSAECAVAVEGTLRRLDPSFLVLVDAAITWQSAN